MSAAEILACGQSPCAEHGKRCAYHGTEPDRCPWCHVSWRHIAATGWHSCEQPSVWKDGRNPARAAQRVAQAVEMRRQGASTGWQSGSCTHGGPGCPGGVLGDLHRAEVAP